MTSVPFAATTTLEKYGMKEVGSVGGKPAIMPTSQAFDTKDKKDLFFKKCTPAPPTNDLTGNNSYKFVLRGGGMQKLNRWRVILNVSESGGSSSVQSTSAVPGFLDNLEIKTKEGAGDRVEIHYGETLWIEVGLLNTPASLSYVLPNLGLTSAYLPSTIGNSSTILAPSGTQNYTMELPRSFISRLRPYQAKVKEDIELNFNFRNSVVSGSGVLSLNNVSLAFDHDDINEKDAVLMTQVYKDYASTRNYLDVNRLETQNMLITKQQDNFVSLRSLSQKVPFLFVMIRSSVSPTNNGYTNLVTIGNQPTSSQYGYIRVLNDSSEDLTGHSTPLSIIDQAEIASSNIPTDMLSKVPGLYMIRFGNVQQALRGEISAGYLQFPSKEYQLVINPDSSFTTGNYTVDVYAYYWKQISVVDGYYKVITL